GTRPSARSTGANHTGLRYSNCRVTKLNRAQLTDQGGALANEPIASLSGRAALRSSARQSAWSASTLGRAGKLDRNAGGDDPFEVHAVVDTNGGASLVIGANDDVRVDILGLADEFAQNKFLPIVLERSAVFGMPGGGSLYPADGIKNTASFDGAG